MAGTQDLPLERPDGLPGWTNLVPLGLLFAPELLARLAGRDPSALSGLGLLLFLAFHLTVTPALAWRVSRARRRTPGPPAAGDAPELPEALAVRPSGLHGRDVRATLLFALFLLAMVAVGLAAQARGSPADAVGLAVVIALGAALVPWLRLPPVLALQGGWLSDGRRRVSVAGEFSVAFAARGPLARVLEGASLAPAVEVRSGSEVLRFRPGRYDRIAGARLVRALAARATSGDARGWLLARVPAPPPDAVEEPPAPPLSPITMAAFAVLWGLFGLIALAALVGRR